MKNLKVSIVLVLLFIGFSVHSHAQNLEKQFDQMLREQYPSNEPGATALVAVDGEIIYHKAFGMANMELEVPMRTEMVLEIGSITKQFTAVSILMLMEQGKLSLEDDITKYLEDYPTQGHKISIHHLLTHTSGIKSYTSLGKWRPEWRKDFTPVEMIDFFKNEPMDFAPGEEYRYNNSAYFILGYIIEIASGMSYEDFIETQIFKPLGMKSSLYGSMPQIIKNRASGYQKQEDFVNAEYLSLTQPYAAGSIMSTVEDLYIWNRAIRSNQLVQKESIALAFTNYKLNNGDPLNYGYGWFLNDINGSPTIEHGGGIFGYLTNSIYLPEEDVFVAVFANCNCNGPDQVSTRMAALAIDKPYPDEANVVSLDKEYLQKLVGVYDFEDASTRIISLEGDQLYSQRTGGTRFEIYPISKSSFYFDDSFASIELSMDGDAVKAHFKNRIQETKGEKTDKEIPTMTEAEIDLKSLEKYIGTFEVQPGFDLVFTIEDGKFMSQATGQDKFQLFSESATKFFLKVVDAQLEFIENEHGNFDSLILYQGGQEIKAIRVDE